MRITCALCRFQSLGKISQYLNYEKAVKHELYYKCKLFLIIFQFPQKDITNIFKVAITMTRIFFQAYLNRHFLCFTAFINNSLYVLEK